MATVKPMRDHIKASSGPDTNINKFYITQYSTTYGKVWEHFKPRTTRHLGTGYSANIRPQVYYSKGLDERDNPVMAEVCSKNYLTTNNLAYQPITHSDGKDPFPVGVIQSGTGYIRDKALTIPDYKTVNGVHIDTRVRPGFCDALPRHVPLLHKLRRKDPVELENARYGPAYMSTETNQRFRGDPTDCVDRSVRTLGPNTETGFTHNKNIEPVTYHPDLAHKNDYPAWLTNRPTGQSVTTTTFLPLETPKGKEPFGVVTPGADRGSGYTNNPVKPAYQSPEKFGLPKSVTTTEFTGKQRPAKTMPDILNTADVGDKSATGFITNTDKYQFSADNPSRFITETMYRFKDPDSRIQLDSPYTRGGIQDRKSCGFCRGSEIHAGSLGQEPNPTRQLQTLEPYVARSIKARDRFHDDHTHDHKTQKSVSFAHNLVRSSTIA